MTEVIYLFGEIILTQINLKMLESLTERSKSEDFQVVMKRNVGDLGPSWIPALQASLKPVIESLPLPQEYRRARKDPPRC